jgi:predicted nuclease with TOPRIM domain
MSGVDRECVTHHYACDCRERRFEQLEKDNCKLAEENRRLYKSIEDLKKSLLRLENKISHGCTDVFCLECDK